ncbi:unnamed protein product [Allacma fusca]|uniref:Uncharacterized protein n=1 Tax=Allacma fusca TaxID=39272 RepID=A0A8J2Q4C4_9HEXA|nr:unnamed protein product [Allacma fusca]
MDKTADLSKPASSKRGNVGEVLILGSAMGVTPMIGEIAGQAMESNAAADLQKIPSSNAKFQRKGGPC